MAILSTACAAQIWTSPNHYRVILTVDNRGVTRSNSPASVNLDLQQTLGLLGSKGAFDADTVEVVAYGPTGQPKVFDASRKGYEKYLLPCRVEPYYGVNYVTLTFVVPDQTYTRYAVYFDTKQSGLGKPKRYNGLVGDGDYFRIGYSRREIGASHMDSFADFDGDGDLDLFKCTLEPFVYCYENVGKNRFVDRGKMTSGGSVFTFPYRGNHRGWPVIMFDDWDGDGDQDLFATFADGPYIGKAVRYENTTRPGGQLTFVFRGVLKTQSGKELGGAWFPGLTVVDWDGDGKKDIIISGSDGMWFHKNTGMSRSVTKIELAEPEAILPDGKPFGNQAPRIDCVDIDSDGDLDAVYACQGGPATLLKNVGTRTKPELAAGVDLVPIHTGHNSAKMADFDGDGLIDCVVSGLWEGIPENTKRRYYARMYKNVGTKKEPKFEERTALNGAPYTEEFQICNGGRQNTVRTADWNSDGRMDLIVGTEQGRVHYFQGAGSGRSPLFADSTPLLTGLKPASRTCVCDWNNDGKMDILAAQNSDALQLYLNVGTAAVPVLSEPQPVQADGKPIGGAHWPSVLVCDWDNDGRKDVIFGVGTVLTRDQFSWPGDSSVTDGILFFKNTGTDAEPMLTSPKWIVSGKDPAPIRGLRLNLGSVVDWNGDGAKDLIIGWFEDRILLYVATEASSENKEPVFSWPAEGTVLVQPWCPQMISGADALDFNQDGDIDILTGQGHGGSGVRFYERDYVTDLMDNTSPIVMTGKHEVRR